MKKLLYLIILTVFSSIKISCQEKNQIIKNAFLSYNLSTDSNELDIETGYSEMYKDAENKEDSTLIKSLIEMSIKLAKDLKKTEEKLSYYIINDTIRIEAHKEKTIYLPDSFKKFTEKEYRDSIYKNEADWGSLYKRWKTDYKTEIDRNDKKEILGVKGYKLIITETSVKSFDTYVEVFELYVSDDYNIPFTYYDFLKLKKQVNFKGLILECKTYYKESPSLNNIYRISDFNFDKQLHKLIEFNKNEYVKYDF